MRYLTAVLALLPVAVSAQTSGVLSPEEIEQLEITVAQNAADRAAQTALGRNYALAILGITSIGQNDTVTGMDPARAASSLAQHARDVLRSSTIAGVLAESGKALWNLGVRASSYSTLKLRARATFNDERALGSAALNRAIALDPETADWRSYRIPITILRSNFTAILPLATADAYALVKDDLGRLKGSPRASAVADAAKLAVRANALDDAEAYANELLAYTGRDWFYGNALYFGNMVLGQVALRRGNVPAAIARLLESGRTPGSPQLNSFGPNMSLAKELLTAPGTAETRESVLNFFDLCGGFWAMPRDRLKQWAEVVRRGGVPDFGANLVY